MTGRRKKKGDEAWRQFMEEAPQSGALGGIETLYLVLETWAETTPTAKRLRKIAEQAALIYEKRFGEEWRPF